MDYATSNPHPNRGSVQDKLRIHMFAEKHGLAIYQVENLLWERTMTHEVCICGCEATEHHLTRRVRLQLEAMGYSVFVTEHCEHRFDITATIRGKCDNQVQSDMQTINGVSIDWAFGDKYDGIHVTIVINI